MRAQDDKGFAWDARGIGDKRPHYYAGLWVADALGFGLSLKRMLKNAHLLRSLSSFVVAAYV